VSPPSDQFNQESFNVSSILFFAMMYTIISNLQAIPQLFAQRVQYVRERSAFLYSTFAFWFANALVNLPLVLASHLLFLNVAYFLVQLDHSPSVFWYTLFITMLNNLISFYFAQFLAAAAPSSQVALAIFPVTFLFLTSFAGFTVPLQDLPSGWVWASYVSYPRWCYEGMVASQFSVRADGASTMEYYGFSDWRPAESFPVLFIFLLLMNGSVYWGLLPKKSQLVYVGGRGRGREKARGEEREERGSALRATLLLEREEEDEEEDEDEDEDSINDEDGEVDEEAGLRRGRRGGRKGAYHLSSTIADVAGQYRPHSSAAPGGTSKGLRQKLLAADEKDLDIPRVLLESLTGTSDTASIDSRLNRGGGREGGGGGAWGFQQPYGESGPEEGGGDGGECLDVKDYESRSSNIQKCGGIRLVFRNLTYSLDRPLAGRRSSRRSRSDGAEKEKMLLKGASGRINPGEMCALMGGSGAGKTTLLDVLAGRKTSGYIVGEVYFNGKAGMPNRTRCSYVTQDNVHIGCFTVRETLWFASLLRIKESVGVAERKKRVENVLGMLGLELVADVLVGDTLRKGISGGQARRLTIGVEIINLPGIIFLDEPTTGLVSTGEGWREEMREGGEYMYEDGEKLCLSFYYMRILSFYSSLPFPLISSLSLSLLCPRTPTSLTKSWPPSATSPIKTGQCAAPSTSPLSRSLRSSTSSSSWRRGSRSITGLRTKPSSTSRARPWTSCSARA